MAARHPHPDHLDQVALSPVTARWVLAAILLASVLAHLVRIDAPPSGFHTWRESDTAAVSEAFLRETGDLFAPRTHQRGATSGVTGMEFPLYNYAVAGLWRVLGFHHWVPRALTVAIGTAGLLGIHALARLLLGRRAALLAVFFAACSPLYFFYGRKIQPDVLLPAATTWALFLFLRGERRGSWADRIGAVALTALAAMVKPTSLAVGVPMLAHVLGRAPGGRPFARLRPWHAAVPVIALGAPALWFAHARDLAERSGLHAFYLGGDWLEVWRRTPWVEFVRKGCLSWPIELALGLPAALVIVAGVVFARPRSARLEPALWWLLGCLGGFLMVSEAITNYHDYYGLIAVPAFALITAACAESLLDSPRRWARGLAALLLVAAPVVTWGRIHQRYTGWTEADFAARRALVDRVIPRGALVTVEDATPAIELYRLGRPGWTFPPGAPDSVVMAQHVAGAEYLVSLRLPISERLGARVEVLHRGAGITIARFLVP